eukprot:gnl/TRDRNA2_/TRDRNA2_202454_c0_seq1.p1 gnl/TRDRNA2_/TRDRNA2_202454_c0~~gnl/TRDRNA2_/TRDRNA2_202454_c0_seq1.p1  ORF type:complete len:223 (-),score=14.62 gnl/TRDRNA2_/TRDRNA2_202454_c0_seq1:262-930(-)
MALCVVLMIVTWLCFVSTVFSDTIGWCEAEFQGSKVIQYLCTLTMAEESFAACTNQGTDSESGNCTRVGLPIPSCPQGFEPDTEFNHGSDNRGQVMVTEKTVCKKASAEQLSCETGLLGSTLTSITCEDKVGGPSYGWGIASPCEGGYIPTLEQDKEFYNMIVSSCCSDGVARDCEPATSSTEEKEGQVSSGVSVSAATNKFDVCLYVCMSVCAIAFGRFLA